MRYNEADKTLRTITKDMNAHVCHIRMISSRNKRINFDHLNNSQTYIYSICVCIDNDIHEHTSSHSVPAMRV